MMRQSRQQRTHDHNTSKATKTSNATIAAITGISVLVLTGCVPQAAPPPSAPTAGTGLNIQQSPIMNGYNTTRDQALLTLEVLTIAPTPDSGHTAADLLIDHDLQALQADWARAGTVNPRCTITNAALQRDGHHLASNTNSCTITSGQWFDPLTGQTLARNEVQPQSFIPAERALASGASQWTPGQLAIYRNSPDSVMSLGKDSYEERGQRGPDQWKPSQQRLWCGYALRWVAEKNTFGLSMENQGEADALTEMLSTCPDRGFADAEA